MSMTDKELVLRVLQDYSRDKAAALQKASADMTGTELYAQEQYIPDFQAAKAAQNMMTRQAGRENGFGFVCRSTAGRVCRLLQPYDSTIYTGEPETLPAQWGFVWSTDPAKALPFVAMSTSPYMTGDCCTDGGKVWRSTIDNNVWAPTAYPQGWEEATGTDTPEPEPAPEPEPGTEPEPGDGEEDIPAFVQPTGAHDAYQTGDRVTYNGHIYESTINNNVWSPDTYPQGWTELGPVGGLYIEEDA